MTMVGVGFRWWLADWIAARPAEVECLEITAEHFYDGGLDRLDDLRRHYPIFVHGLGLSLGTAGPLDEDNLERFAAVSDAAQPRWVSEHVAFSRTAEVDLGHLNPVLPNSETLDTLVEHVGELSRRCAKPVILENITTSLRVDGEFRETEFLNRLAEQAGCGLLLDVTNLWINSRNHGFESTGWLHELQPEHIVQLHVVGYSEENGRLEDRHCEPLQDDLIALVEEVMRFANPQAVILERDDPQPAIEDITRDLQILKEMTDGS